MEPVILALGCLLFLFIIWGIGVPVPEESALLLGGSVAAIYGTFWPVVVTCTLGIAIADTFGYVRGRLRAREFAKFKRGHAFIGSAGAFALLTSRALISVRAVVPFMAGAMRMNRARFHLTSVLGAAVSSMLVVAISAWCFAQLPPASVALWWAALCVIATGILVMYATRAQATLARETKE